MCIYKLVLYLPALDAVTWKSASGTGVTVGSEPCSCYLISFKFSSIPTLPTLPAALEQLERDAGTCQHATCARQECGLYPCAG